MFITVGHSNFKLDQSVLECYLGDKDCAFYNHIIIAITSDV
jgi:hypothetical protein